MVKKLPTTKPAELVELTVGIERVPDKELPKITQRALDYIDAQIDILLHQQIISIIEELKVYRAKSNDPR